MLHYNNVCVVAPIQTHIRIHANAHVIFSEFRQSLTVCVDVFCVQMISLTRPLDSWLEHVDFRTLFRCLSDEEVLQVFAATVLERRIIFIADELRYSPKHTHTHSHTCCVCVHKHMLSHQLRYVCPVQMTP